MQYTVKPHCTDYKLVGQVYTTKTGFISLVYGEAADGTNQGLKAYYTKDGQIGHHHSRRWLLADVPKKYQAALLQLRLWVVHCPVGHKLILA